MKALLTATHLSFSYSSRRVLDELSVSVAAGELVGLIGANGSGKTTLLRVLLRLLPALSGEVQLAGVPLASLGRRQIALRAALVQQDTHLDFAFTGREIVAMGRSPYLGRFAPETKADQEAIQFAMQVTETDTFAHRLVTELSGGERQRLHLARALAQDTPIILLDEPMAHLDLSHQFEALSLLRKMTRQDKGALAAIHDLSLAARFCDRLLILARGKIVAEGPPPEVITERNLAEFFALEARVRRDEETGALIISPLSTIRVGRAGSRSVEEQSE